MASRSGLLKPKMFPWKMLVDILMLVFLLIQMSFVLTGQRIHEHTGTVMVTLVILHNLLNRKWYTALSKGTYHRKRIVQTILNLITVCVMLALLVSGVTMSRYVFRFLPFYAGRAMARKVHITCAYWAFLLMCLHFGMHWKSIWRKMQQNVPFFSGLARTKYLLSIIVWGVTIYGIYAFYRQEIFSFLLMQNIFAIFEDGQTIFGFVSDYLAILVMLVHISGMLFDYERRNKS